MATDDGGVGLVVGPVTARKQGARLVTDPVSIRPDGKRPASREWTSTELTGDASRWFAAAADGDEIALLVHRPSLGAGTLVPRVDPSAAHLVPAAPEPSRAAGRPATPAAVRPGRGDQPRERAAAVEQRRGGAVNPYTFVPAPSRRDVGKRWADRPPTPAGRVGDDEWWGDLVVRFTTLTPMLLPDQESATGAPGEHRTYPMRTRGGSPSLHGASVKGSLRAVYEAVTASRFGVFGTNREPLAFRLTADHAVGQLQAARVEKDPTVEDGLRFVFCDTFPLPSYGDDDRVPLPGIGAPNEKQVLFATSEGVVTAVRGLAGPAPAPPGFRRGWLSITGECAPGKVNERVFAHRQDDPRSLSVTPEHHEAWSALMRSYFEASRRFGRRRGRYVPPSYLPSSLDAVPKTLKEGNLVWLRLVDGQVERVNAAMVGRALFGVVPADLVDQTLRPAQSWSELSAADRVFGWVPLAGAADADGQPMAHQGRLAVVDVVWDADAVSEERLRIGPLSSPKPSQFRFYAAKDDTGAPVDRGVPKPEGFAARRVRGRKAYWYPASVAEGYWTPGPQGQPMPGGGYREWQDHGSAAALTQTHESSIKVGASFTVRLRLRGVEEGDLAPLLWLLGEVEGSPLRFGAGKPYGFGAASAEVVEGETRLWRGSQVREGWMDLTRPEPVAPADLRALARSYAAAAEADPVVAPAVAAIERVAAGLPAPAHYPRRTQAPQAETFEWFVENERVAGEVVQQGWALPHVLEDEQRLPRL